MKRLIKLVVLLIISLSVIFIYNQTNNSSYTITSIGDKLSLGYNSYGIKEYSYIDFIKEEYEKEKDKVNINQEYSSTDQTIKNTLNIMKNTPNIKKVLSDSNLLIITLGYNDLLVSISMEEEMSPSKLNKILEEINKNYQELITEIKKYYHNNIVVVGYYSPNINDYYKEKGIQELNKILQNNQNIIYIDTNNLLKDREKYFQNPKSYYPNHYAYDSIAQKIIRKTLENKENI